MDRPAGEIDSGRSRIYGAIDCPPPHGSLETGGDDYVLADSYTLADDLTFERSNPDSIWNCFMLSRENARQMRHCISSEMWTRLNLAYLRLRGLGIVDIWQASPESFYAETAAEINTFLGVAESTMYRDDGWSFMQLGRLVERSQFLGALLLAELSADSLTATPDWVTLLRLCHALDAHNRCYGGEGCSQPTRWTSWSRTRGCRCQSAGRWTAFRPKYPSLARVPWRAPVRRQCGWLGVWAPWCSTNGRTGKTGRAC